MKHWQRDYDWSMCEVQPKPCPYCGSTVLYPESSGSQEYVNCADCGAIGPSVKDGQELEEMVKAWNRRDGEKE